MPLLSSNSRVAVLDFTGKKIADAACAVEIGKLLSMQYMFTGTAADVYANLVIGVYEHWFLPSKEELNLMYFNLQQAGVGGFADDYYWSSSEGNDSYAWSQYFYDGDRDGSNKPNVERVRAARAF